MLNLLAVAGSNESEWAGRLASLNAYQGYGWAGGLVLGLVWTTAVGRVLGGLATLGSLSVACGLSAAVAAVAAARLLPPEAAGRSVRGRELARAMRRATRTDIRGATFPTFPGRLYWGTREFRVDRFAERFTPELATYYAAVVLFFTGFAAFFAPLPLFLSEAGFGDGRVFAMYLASGLGAAVFFTRAGRLVERYDATLVHAAGLFARAGALPVVAVVAGIGAGGPAAFLATGAVFVGIGLTWAVIAVAAVTLVTRLAPRPSVARRSASTRPSRRWRAAPAASSAAGSRGWATCSASASPAASSPSPAGSSWPSGAGRDPSRPATTRRPAEPPSP